MNVDVAIVGAGLVGGSLAAALSGAGVSVALIDARSEPQDAGASEAFDQRVFALRPGSKQFLQACGVWAHIDEERTAPVYRMLVTGDDGGSQLRFDAYRSGVAELAVIAEDRELRSAMHAALAASPLVSRIEASCESIHMEDQGATVVLDDGDPVQARLLVAADGARSRVRDLAGLRVREHPYGHSAVVANFAASRPHHGTAWQWFRNDGVLALLPLPGPHVSMVWSARQELAEELMALDRDALAARVSEASAGVAGELSAAGAPATFPLRLMRAESIVGARLALVGDAAHNVHPLAGQGLNLGLADAQALAAIIARRGPDEVGSAALLARYRRSRAEDIMAMTFATDGLHRLFQSSLPGVSWLRNTGLRITERVAPLKRLLVKHAAG